MDTVSMLNKMSFYCQPILPLVYDESMSYYETLCKVVGQLNTTGETVNKLNEGLTGEISDRQSADAALDARIKEIEKVNKKIHFLVFDGANPNGGFPTRHELYQWVEAGDAIFTLFRTNEEGRGQIYAASCSYNAGNWGSETSNDFSIIVPIETSYDATKDYTVKQKVVKLSIPLSPQTNLNAPWRLQIIEINTPSTSAEGVVNLVAVINDSDSVNCSITPTEFLGLYNMTRGGKNLCVAVNAKLAYDGLARSSSVATVDTTNRKIRIAFECDHGTFINNGVKQLNKTLDYIIGDATANVWTHETIDSKILDFSRYEGFQFTRGAHNVITTDDESTPNAVYTQYHDNESGKLYQNLPTRLIDTVDNTEYWNGTFDIKDGNHMTFTFVTSNYATDSDKMLVRVIELSANVNTTTWNYTEKEFELPISASGEKYVVESTSISDGVYDTERKKTKYTLTFDKTNNEIISALNSGKDVQFKVTFSEGNETYPVYFSVGYTRVDVFNNVPVYMFVGSMGDLDHSVITVYGVTDSDETYRPYLTTTGGILPEPNPDDSDDGKVLAVNKHKWEMKKPKEDFVVAITTLSPSAVPTSVDGGIAQFTAACDKTFTEINGAIDAGKNVLGNYSGNIWPLSRATDTMIAFEGTISLVYFGDTRNATCSFVIQSNGIATITCAAGELPAPSSDGSDNGKVPTVNGTRWEMKKPVVDEALSDTSTNPVQNKAVKAALDKKANNTEATEQAAGLMSAKDKKKLNGIADGANKTIVDEMLSDGSTNPVQNKAVTAALATVVRESIYPITVTATSAEWTVNNGIAYKEASADRTFDDIKAAYNGNKTLVCEFERMTYSLILTSSTAFIFASYRGAVANDSQYAGLGKYPTSLITINTTGVVISRTAGDLPAVGVTDNDKMLIVSGGEWALQRVPGATVDAELSTTSENPVQNKTVTAALNDKLPKTGGTVTGALRTNDSFSAGGTIAFGEAPIVLSQTDDGAAKILYGSADVNDNPPPLSRLKVARPTADDDAATKKYVDDRNDSPQFKGYVTLTPANAPLGTGVGLSPSGSGNDFTLDISDVNEGTPTLLTGVKTPTDAYTNAAATVEYVKAKVASSGSPNAVLYTAQTLTDAQKKQARDNLDAAGEFVINGTLNRDMAVTLDKTFEQIKEAINAGKTPIVLLNNSNYLSIVAAGTEYILFSTASGDDKEISFFTLYVYPHQNPQFNYVFSVVLNPDKTMPQVYMDSDPTEAMQIATKKYVDDKAKKAVVIDVSEEEVRSYNYSDIDSEITNGGANVWLSLGTNQMRMVAYDKTGASSYELTFVNFVANTFNIHTITVSPSAASYAYITK